MSTRCVWCNKDVGTIRDVSIPMINRFGTAPTPKTFSVHLEHEEAFRRFAGNVVGNGRTFILVVVVVSLLMLAAVIGGAIIDRPDFAGIGAGTGTIVMAAAMIKWPFATPETVGMIGLRRAIVVVRALAVGLMALGAVILISLR